MIGGYLFLNEYEIRPQLRHNHNNDVMCQVMTLRDDVIIVNLSSLSIQLAQC